jgi:hypothetical protein
MACSVNYGRVSNVILIAIHTNYLGCSGGNTLNESLNTG